ncbi:unnamed protein product [Nezara viridula]|uniref:Uncharacterized protein n=1 Tax=Nezara viridula TaxID=85310 RepID=A0A9P0MRA2_NEZVI|nr:unnamed protein product [Nezara viridula]
MVQWQATRSSIADFFGANLPVSFLRTHSDSRTVTNLSKSTDYGCSESAGARGPIFLYQNKIVHGPNLRGPTNILLDFNMSADLMFDSDSSLSPASAEVRDLMEFGVRPRLLDYLSDGESTDWTDEETDTEDEIQTGSDVEVIPDHINMEIKVKINKESCSGTLSEEVGKNSEDVSNGVEIKTNDPAVEDHNDEPAILNNPIEQDAKNGEETSNGIQVEPNDPAVEDQNGERTIIYDPIEQLNSPEEDSNCVQVVHNDPAGVSQNDERTIYDCQQELSYSSSMFLISVPLSIELRHLNIPLLPDALSSRIPCILYPPRLFLILIQILSLPIPSHNPK